MKFPSSMKIKETKPNLEIEVVNPQKDIMTWLNAVGKYQTTVDADGNISGELSFENKIFNFTIKNKGNIIKIVFCDAFSGGSAGRQRGRNRIAGEWNFWSWNRQKSAWKNCAL